MFEKMKFLITAPRVGPDMFPMSLLMHSRYLSRLICKKKFLFFGDGAEIRYGAYIVGTKNISIGSNVVVRPGSMIHADSDISEGKIFIHDKVLMGSGVHIYTDNHNFDLEGAVYDQGHRKSQSVVIKKGAWIGANVVVLPGVTIGENSVVGAGSIVTRSIPKNSLATGSPAKVIKSNANSSDRN